jgi:hypothetical protein
MPSSIVILLETLISIASVAAYACSHTTTIAFRTV